jgi:hypothetical protein
MATSLNVVESETKLKINPIIVSEMMIGVNQDDSNQSTSSSTTLDQMPSASSGSNGHESDAANRETASPESEDGTGGVFNFNRGLRQHPKSVCFHSVTSQSGEKKITSGKSFWFSHFQNQINFHFPLILINFFSHSYQYCVFLYTNVKAQRMQSA